MNLGLFSFVFCVWTLILSPHQKSALRRLQFKSQRREKTILITSSWLTKSAIKRQAFGCFWERLETSAASVNKILNTGLPELCVSFQKIMRNYALRAKLCDFATEHNSWSLVNTYTTRELVALFVSFYIRNVNVNQSNHIIWKINIGSFH